MVRTNNEIMSWVDAHTYYKYWYGGKRRKATAALARSLMDQNPSVWTASYFKKALEDVTNGESVCDCSGYVCGAYSIPDIGSSQIPQHFLKWTEDKYVPGMIAWKKGHCGIIIDTAGHVAEMRGIDTDFCKNRTFTEAGFTHIYYAAGVTYDRNLDKIDHEIGWHGTGTACWYSPTGKKGDYLRDGFYMIRGHLYYFGHDGYSKVGVQYVNDIPYAFGYDGLMISDGADHASMRYAEWGDIANFDDIDYVIISAD